MKTQLLQDFNQILEQLVDETRGMKTPLLIFTFSDPNEQTKQFLSKLLKPRLNQDFRQQGVIKQLSIN